MITTFGFSLVMAVSISARLVSHINFTSPVNVPIRAARILICFKDSSPDTYKVGTPADARFLHTCKRIVDFPIPGSPPTSTREPGTMPPPRTLSSSAIPALKRSVSEVSISSKVTGFAPFPDIRREVLPEDFTTGSSTKLFHALHPGHCPIHLADSYPHS